MVTVVAAVQPQVVESTWVPDAHDIVYDDSGEIQNAREGETGSIIMSLIKQACTLYHTCMLTC